MSRRGPALAIAAFALALAIESPGAGEADGASSLVLAAPEQGRVYEAAFPDFGGPEDRVSVERLAAFEKLAGRPIAWAYFSNNWDEGIRFPVAAVNTIAAAGRVPFIRMMARSDFDEGGPDERYTMQSIVAGDWDADLRAWCADAAATAIPLLVEFGTEVNGDWFPWNGRWNGGGETAGYGDPSLADGPERFRDAYRHIVDLCREQGADNLTWFFHVDVGSYPNVAWNSDFANYYPGDGYVDWIGVSDYGPLVRGDGWTSFRDRLDAAYPQLEALAAPGDKPIAVLEYGARESGNTHRKAAWIRAAIESVASGRWPRVVALSYWHERWRNSDGSISDLRLDSSRRARRAYRTAIAAPAFTSEPRFEPGG
ncbi:MAG TPA: glycosyl hydrolase [Solirubrobacterales bacterium]|nr:glycosyl hydrolase [Solirubrobacterales bacterium]